MMLSVMMSSIIIRLLLTVEYNKFLIRVDEPVSILNETKLKCTAVAWWYLRCDSSLFGNEFISV